MREVDYAGGFVDWSQDAHHYLLSSTIASAGGTSSEIIPTAFVLFQNYPNPFNPSTNIRFDLPAGKAAAPGSGFVSLKVYNVLGQEVATLVNEVKPQGRYEVMWDASRQASGVYFYRLQYGEFLATKKSVIIR